MTLASDPDGDTSWMVVVRSLFQNMIPLSAACRLQSPGRLRFKGTNEGRLRSRINRAASRPLFHRRLAKRSSLRDRLQRLCHASSISGIGFGTVADVTLLHGR